VIGTFYADNRNDAIEYLARHFRNLDREIKEDLIIREKDQSRDADLLIEPFTNQINSIEMTYFKEMLE
jgi:hypothetical protein